MESLAWYRKAAEGGDVAAQKMLAWRQLEGNGVPKDPAAAAWYRCAADAGNPDAQVTPRLVK